MDERKRSDGMLTRIALSPGRKVLERMNRRSLEKAHARLAAGMEEGHVRKLYSQVERLRAGEPAFVDRPAVKKAAVLLYKMLEPTGLGKVVGKGLASRSQKIFDVVAPHIAGDSVLDLGCGDGKVGEKIARRLGKGVTLCDVVDYNKTSLPLVVYDGSKLPFQEKQFDCTLISAVLHHSDDPLKVLDEAFRVTAKRMVVIESTYFNEAHRMANAFLDWAYNRILNDPEINVPWNFLRPAGWVHELEKRGGRIVHMEHLGLDVPIVPEWHVMYVVDLVPCGGENPKANVRDLEWEERFGYLKNVPFGEKELNCQGSKFQIIRFEPGSILGPHHHLETTEIFYVIRGNGIIRINGKEIMCEPGDFMLCKPGNVHEVINDREEEFVVLVFKTNEKAGDMHWDS
jgi:quercetin dioxygenase-like cupin family protein/2-polyprenyl-3-methyl-5-hydroxy-6-metoxy-1,4-benzoquinol methylase